MKILTFAASNSRNSINRKLVTYASSLIKNAEILMLDIHDYEMPIYSIDREQQDGIPELAKQFFARIGEADALLISYAEHNGSYTAAFKNLYDWASRIDSKVFQGKPMVILSTSPGPGGAASVLATAKKSAGFFGGEVLADISVPKFHDNFDRDTDTISNVEIRSRIEHAVSLLTHC